MSNLLKLKIVTPDEVLFQGKVKKLSTETLEGKIEILPMHSPLIAALKSTTSKMIKDDGEEMQLSSSEGILKVNNEEVLMLCDEAKWIEK